MPRFFTHHWQRQSGPRKLPRGCSHAAGFLRRELGRRLRIHHIPELHFTFDASVERGTRLSRLIDEVVAADAAADNREQ